VRSTIYFVALLFLAAFASPANHQGANTQEHTYSSPKTNYLVDFPSATWKLVDEPDELHQNAEFVYGDRVDGYLRIRREALDEGVSLSDFARHDMEQKNRYLPGYVDGKQDPFSGKLSGVTASYEFTQSGKPMSGRTYYLQGEKGSVYVLRFTGMRDKLLRIRNQTDMIARSLRIKS
jgi:hypothetical protein